MKHSDLLATDVFLSALESLKRANSHLASQFPCGGADDDNDAKSNLDARSLLIGTMMRLRDVAEAQGLAHDIAFESAKTAIECEATQVSDGDTIWLEMSSTDMPLDWESEYHQELRYLDLCGALIHHPIFRHWVRIGDSDAA